MNLHTLIICDLIMPVAVENAIVRNDLTVTALPYFLFFYVQQSMVASRTGWRKAVVQHVDKEKEN